MIDSSTAPPPAVGTDVHVPERPPRALTDPPAKTTDNACVQKGCGQPRSAHELGIFCP